MEIGVKMRNNRQRYKNVNNSYSHSKHLSPMTIVVLRKPAFVQT